MGQAGGLPAINPNGAKMALGYIRKNVANYRRIPQFCPINYVLCANAPMPKREAHRACVPKKSSPSMGPSKSQSLVACRLLGFQVILLLLLLLLVILASMGACAQHERLPQRSVAVVASVFWGSGLTISPTKTKEVNNNPEMASNETGIKWHKKVVMRFCDMCFVCAGGPTDSTDQTDGIQCWL